MWGEAMNLAESSVRLDPRSSFAFSILAYLHAMEGHHEDAMDAAKRAVELNPYDMGARGVLGICYLVIGEHRQAIELFSIGRPARQQRSQIQVGGIERVQPLFAQAI